MLGQDITWVLACALKQISNTEYPTPNVEGGAGLGIMKINACFDGTLCPEPISTFGVRYSVFDIQYSVLNPAAPEQIFEFNFSAASNTTENIYCLSINFICKIEKHPTPLPHLFTNSKKLIYENSKKHLAAQSTSLRFSWA